MFFFTQQYLYRFRSSKKGATNYSGLGDPEKAIEKT